MGHRHIFNTPQIFETDSDQGWNNSEQHYIPMTRSVAPESSSLIYPVDNTIIQGGQHFPPQWTPAPLSSEYSPHYQPQAPGPSRDPLMHQSVTSHYHISQDNYSHHPSSSTQTVPGVGDKRKSPPVCAGRYYDVGSSSNRHLPSDPWEEKHNSESYNTSWEYPPNYRSNINSECTMRNVRSRVAVDMETNPSRTHMSSNSFANQFPNTEEWNRSLVFPAGHGGTFGSDSSFFSHVPYNSSNNQSYGSLEIGGYNSDITTSNRNPIPQTVTSNSNQSVRVARSGSGQRSFPNFNASSINFRPASDEGPPIVAESYPSRHQTAFSSIRFRNTDRNGRALISSDRHRSLNEEANFRDRLMPQGVMVVGHSSFHGSRALFDQHRDMRLDTDIMTYEELLALGDTIGIVNTGLSDHLISKCLVESIYCSSDLLQDEETCVICLDEYKNMDDVGTVKVCGHDFHAGCIRKWLSMKNLCPICKATAMDNANKEK